MVAPLQMREKYGFEPFRYFLLRDMSYGLDSSFSEEALVTRTNADLANNLGNLASRTLNMTVRYCEGTVPEPGETGEAEAAVANAVAAAADALVETMARLEPHRALEAIFLAVDATNRYLDATAPWTAAKEGRDGDVRRALYTGCQALRGIGLLLLPFIPEAATELLERIGADVAGARLPDSAREWDALRPGTPTRKGAALFPRAELPTEDDA
jgi:methionyl-tRNA synthetase